MIEWFRHDTDARNDIKIRRLLRDSDIGALGAYWLVVEIIYQHGGYAEKSTLCEELSFYGAEKYIDTLVEHGLIEDVGNDVVTSQRVLKELEFQAQRSKVRAEAGRLGGLAKASNAKQVLANGKHCLAKSSTIQYKTIQDNKYNKSLSKDSLFGEKHSSSPTEKQENTDLFGEKIEEEQEKVPYTDVINYWNKVLAGKLPQVRQLTDTRRILIKQRWAEYHSEVYKAIDNVAVSDFLVGWKSCGFDWCFKKSNMIKILEGNYENKTKKDDGLAKHKDYSLVDPDDLNTEGFDWGLSNGN